MTKIFELIMLLCFGAAWPMNLYRSWVTRSAKGKSVAFLIAILIGYIAGIINKLINGIDYVLWFYILNFVMVSCDFILYFRNRHLDKKRAAEQK